ncbi:hypothetical protein SprV_0200683900 [Sparganum proliferum]
MPLLPTHIARANRPLPTPCNNNLTTSISPPANTPAPKSHNHPATGDHDADAPPLSNTGTFILASTPASLTATSSTPSLTSTTNETASDVSPIIVFTNDSTDSIPTCLHCDRTLSPLIGLVGHLRAHRTVTDVPVPRVPTYIRPHSLQETIRSHTHPLKWRSPRYRHSKHTLRARQRSRLQH